jgi:hypothetical protein
MEAEGWYRDPYGRHEDRWFSAGHATKLVRDQGIEASDPPPDEPLPQPLVECDEGAEIANGDDMKRADSATRDEEPITNGQEVRAVLDDAQRYGYWPH